MAPRFEHPSSDLQTAPASGLAEALPARRWLNADSDWPSWLLIAAVVVNTTLIASTHGLMPLIALALVQMLLLMGCQEAKHLCVHGTFLTNKRANDAVGTLCGALSGVNFWAFRHFHLVHHRTACTHDDPEGEMYGKSWRTRWIWLLAPIEQPWVAFHINRAGWRLTPPAFRRSRNLGMLFVVGFALLLAALAFKFPRTVMWAYAIPFVTLTYFDFLLTQAEHYAVEVVPSSAPRRSQIGIGGNVVLPAWLAWPMLNRGLHGLHHVYPGQRWFPDFFEAERTRRCRQTIDLHTVHAALDAQRPAPMGLKLLSQMNGLDLQVLAQAREWHSQGHSVWLVTVVETWGSAPRPPGALMALRGDGAVAGSVSGGCVEDDLMDRVRQGVPVERPTLLRYGITKEEAAHFGLPCGGNLRLLQEPLNDVGWIDAVLSRTARHELVMRVLHLASGHIELAPASLDETFAFDGATLKSFFGPRWRMLIVGAGALSQVLASQALALDFEVILLRSP